MDREEELACLKKQDYWEVLIIGGGATGLALALDSASRGYKTLLLEAYDFTKGTSSRSTKLLHGGVRYLEQGNFSLVYEALHERNYLFLNAPWLCKKQGFVISTPSYFQNWYYYLGLKFYDLLAGKLNIGKSKKLSKSQIQTKLKGLKTQKIQNGICYYDGSFDDARMGISLAKTAHFYKACLLNYMEVQDFLRDEKNQIAGVKAYDKINHQAFKIKAKCVINATGVFSDSITQMDRIHAKITPSQGVHLVVDKTFFPNEDALLVPKTSDGRVLFIIPWYEKVLLGTTDTLVKEVSYEPKALKEEIDFILQTANEYLEKELSKEDILSVFVGLRPLISKQNQNTKELSRSHKIELSPNKLLSINGGKWTTCRIMAEETLNFAIKNGLLEPKICQSKHLKHYGYGESIDSSQRLRSYGLDSLELRKLEETELGKKIHPNYPFTYAQVFWALKYEMAQNIEDVLARRIRLLFIDAKACEECANEVNTFIAGYFNHSKERSEKEKQEFIKLVKQYQIKD